MQAAVEPAPRGPMEGRGTGTRTRRALAPPPGGPGGRGREAGASGARAAADGRRAGRRDPEALTPLGAGRPPASALPPGSPQSPEPRPEAAGPCPGSCFVPGEVVGLLSGFCFPFLFAESS